MCSKPLVSHLEVDRASLPTLEPASLAEMCMLCGFMAFYEPGDYYFPTST